MFSAVFSVGVEFLVLFPVSKKNMNEKTHPILSIGSYIAQAMLVEVSRPFLHFEKTRIQSLNNLRWYMGSKILFSELEYIFARTLQYSPPSY